MGALSTLAAVRTSCPGRAPVNASDPALRPAAVLAADAPLSALDAVRSAATAAAARDWLETQARVVEYWRDLLADAGATDDLIEALEIHAAFLNGVVARG